MSLHESSQHQDIVSSSVTVNYSNAHNIDRDSAFGSTQTKSITGSDENVVDLPEKDEESVSSNKAIAARSSIAGMTISAIQRDGQKQERQQYSLQSSAYVQNLAEICFTIQNDIRWRVKNQKNGKHAERLFDWKKGDDLSIINTLARLYRPMKSVIDDTDTQSVRCTCLCCHDNLTGKRYAAKQGEAKEHVRGLFFDDAARINVDEMHEDDIRSIYLYCRLFYRKGPWFRLDNIYRQYYSPKQLLAKDDVASLNDEIDGVTDSNLEVETIAPKDNFFSPSKYKSKAIPISNDSVKVLSTSIDESLLSQHIERLAHLLLDIRILTTKGFIRSFIDEAECGKTVGSTLLTMDERKLVLSKLGCKGNKKNSKSPSSSGIDRQINVDENEIWKQMKQQQSLKFFLRKESSDDCDDKKLKLLPVQRHVDDIIFGKLVKAIVQSCSATEYVPAPVMKVYSESIRSSIIQILKSHQSDTKTNFESQGVVPVMCFRLQDTATLTLRRCIRLYVCAAGGPGVMRGDGSNGWRSVINHFKPDSKPIMPPLAKAVPPPCARLWFQLQYPGLLYRFGLKSSCYMKAYRHHLVDEGVPDSAGLSCYQVFTSHESFSAWETCVELRANVDYLVELNETLRYNQRRHDQGKEPRHGKKSLFVTDDSVDLLRLLEETSRKSFFEKLLAAVGTDNFHHTFVDIENDIQQHESHFERECEKILAVIGIVATHVLLACNKYITSDEVELISSRPWLRHLFWPASLAYVLWDIFPIIERCGVYSLAIKALEVLLFGRVQGTPDSGQQNPCFPSLDGTSKLAPFLISRRAKGKAFDRLIIDYGHFHRLGAAEDTNKAAKRASSQALHSKISSFCQSIIRDSSQKSSIGFSSIRTLARRLKQPLSRTLNSMFCFEGFELGLRFENNSEILNDETKYSDWTPITDRTVANSLESDDNNAGSRCAFVGFEDDSKGTVAAASLNVEQLAIEYYKTGRLPPTGGSQSSCTGGWSGFHDEGGHVRALFRILCSAPVLGMDWGCALKNLESSDIRENATIHLSPYQEAPFDLHVGFQLLEMESSEGNHIVPCRGFYCRRQDQITKFLFNLSALTSQQLCDLVYHSIRNRLEYMAVHKQKDPFVERDVAQLRTLSLIAAGCGGCVLASIFRCLFFDYRHYSGGLPDLLLIRAIYDDDSNHLVHLGEWVGELISSEYIEALDAGQRGSILYDLDDEFLGCSKVGDSGGRQARSSPGRQQNQVVASLKFPSLDMLGERLLLEHDGRKVRVECMMVEVKSSNDRLDARQEDWLNILDKHGGNARVCKFEQVKSVKIKNKQEIAKGSTLSEDY